MREKNPLLEKSFSFSIKIVNLYKFLSIEKHEYVLSKQLLRSGTSIGANVEEAVGGISKKDFVAKLYISYKEARETKYWLRLLYATKYIDQDTFDSTSNNCEELLKIIGSSLKTARLNDKMTK